MIVEGEVNLKLSIWHSRWVDKQTIEEIEVGRCPLSTVNSRFGTTGERSLQEGLHLSRVGEGESGASLEGDEDIVGVDVGCSNLGQCSSSWNHHWSIGIGGCVGRRSDWDHSRSAN